MRHRHTFRSLQTSILLFLSAIPLVLTAPQSVVPVKELSSDRQHAIYGAITMAIDTCIEIHSDGSAPFSDCALGRLSSIGIYPMTKVSATPTSSSLPWETTSTRSVYRYEPTATMKSVKYAKAKETSMNKRNKIIGVVAGLVVGTFLLVVILYCAKRRKGKAREARQERQEQTTPAPTATRHDTRPDDDNGDLPTYQEATRNW